ncbi:hypothetical protein ACFL6U_08910 [Planctomycetota bacterium]
MPEKDHPDQCTSPIRLLIQLKEGKIQASDMSKDSRLACIEYLCGKGHNNAELAEILSLSIRSIQRYKQEIRRLNAVQQTQDFKDQQIGRMIKSAEAFTEKLLKMSSNDQTANHDVISALELAWKIQKESIFLYQTLGYLPYLAPLQTRDGQEQVMDIEGIFKGIKDLEHAVEHSNIDDADTMRLIQVQKKLFIAADKNMPITEIQQKLLDSSQQISKKDKL